MYWRKNRQRVYEELLAEMEIALKTVRLYVREFAEDLVRRLIKTIIVKKGEKLEIQFGKGIVMKTYGRLL